MINTFTQVLYTTAIKLSELAKKSMPTLRRDETIQREWFKNASLYRETNLNKQRFIAEFDFQEKKSYQILIGEGNAND